MGLFNIVDILIILFILLFGVIGFKRGVIKQLVSTVGTLLVYFLAWKLKGGLADVLMQHLPFFNFPGSFEGVSVLNIILYQFIAFIIIAIVLLIVLNILIKVSSIIEKVLKFTIILGIPSKILGFIVGAIEGFIVVYIALFFLHQPSFNEFMSTSKLTEPILNSTPILSNIAGSMNKAFTDIYALTDKFQTENKNQFNLETLDIMLKYDIVNKDSVNKLIELDKLHNIAGIETILSKY